ncbi:hypothetical protein RI367_006472 [Sorochytrium milnesiophthora]
MPPRKRAQPAAAATTAPLHSKKRKNAKAVEDDDSASDSTVDNNNNDDDGDFLDDAVKTPTATPSASSMTKKNSFSRRSGGGVASSSSSSSLAAAGTERATPLARVIDDTQFAAVPFKPTPEEISQSYEQWMKLAADNKINTANTWNLGLIDYFHDMLVLRDGESINFQKASCTLDGCVKIYTSRVDSVASETEKLVSGLVESTKTTGSATRDEDGEDGGEDEENADGERVRRKRPKGPAKTLEKSFAPITLKKFDLEFSVDPLFRKTSADFDEGGARGLLLNHLSMYNGRIVFDASDAVIGQEAGKDAGRGENGAVEQDDQQQRSRQSAVSGMDVDGDDRVSDFDKDRDDDDDDEEDGGAVQARSGREGFDENDGQQMIDISKLKQRFDHQLADIMQRSVCPSLQNFKFTSSASAFDNLLLGFTRSDPADAFEMVSKDDDGPGGSESVFMDAAAGGEADYVDFADVGGDQGNAADAYGFVDFDNMHESDGDERASEDGGNAMFANADAEGDRVIGPTSAHNDILAFFDQALARNWAGPEHWKLRKIARETHKPDEPKDPKMRKKREPFSIDFMTDKVPDVRELFAASSASINLPKNTAAVANKHLLPPDTRFSSKDLLHLFTKPKALVSIKSNMSRSSTGASLRAGVDDTAARAAGDIVDDYEDVAGQDVDFNAFEMPVDDDDDNSMRMDNGGDGDNTQSHQTMPQSSQYYLDDDQEETVQLGDYEADDAIYPTIIKTNRILINYARTAKRVDVKRLKDNIWRQLSHALPAPLDKTPTPADDPIKADGDDDSKPVQTFTDVVNSLSGYYPKQQFADISIPFCFICLLHLANEKNLEIEGSDNTMQELIIRQ